MNCLLFLLICIFGFSLRQIFSCISSMQDNLDDDSENPQTLNVEKQNINTRNCYVTDCLLYPIVFCVCCACWCSHGCPHPRKGCKNIDQFLCSF